MERSKGNAENLPMKIAKSPRAREGGASIGDRLALDDSAIDGHTKMEISAKVEISQTSRWQRRTVGIDMRINIDQARMV